MESFLDTRTLIMLVAPTAMGKSTIMNIAVEFDSHFTRVRSFTTRPHRTNDEMGQYIYLTDAELVRERSNGTVVTETTFPTTGYTYGTLYSSYLGEFCLLDTLANSVAEYRALPFRRTLTVSLTAAPEDWRAWFISRYPERSDMAVKRLEEAKLSIAWSLEDPETTWLVNDSTPEAAAAKLLQLTHGTIASDPTGPDCARRVLEAIEQGSVWA